MRKFTIHGEKGAIASRRLDFYLLVHGRYFISFFHPLETNGGVPYLPPRGRTLYGLQAPRGILNCINPISKLLQIKDYDLPSAMELLKNCKDFFKHLRSDTAFNEMLENSPTKLTYRLILSSPSHVIEFDDEAHFWLNGYVNKQNCRIWSEANPQVYVETPLHPEKRTVWCALWAGGIIGPYFFKNDECHNVTVNGDRYRAMITNFFIPELDNQDVQELWFQQDDATCHTSRATIDLLKDTFGDRLISRFGPVNWPPRSCDLTPLDYFLWDYVKSLVYADKPQTLDHLEDIIRRVIPDIRPKMLEKVIEN
ncbi:transposable element Tc3 transposase [Trichonephila clavipes]|uniref:Transposable element Tc3 transposase n=1 Tax=Trichonephila clavipes TaxID=2585209 RepID=A0A8X6SN81_TRICX|nr:transposable element Tc3 transposase [Trichonephila clavipes]